MKRAPARLQPLVIPWAARADYLRALQALADWCRVEQNRAQMGETPAPFDVERLMLARAGYAGTT